MRIFFYLATDLLATVDSAGANLNALAKCYFNTEKVLFEAMKDFLLPTQSFQKTFLSGVVQKSQMVKLVNLLNLYFQNAEFSA